MLLKEALHICRQTHAPETPVFRAGLTCGFTPLHLATLFQAYLQRSMKHHRVAVDTGLYGDFIGNLERHLTSSDAVAVVLEWSDLDPRLGIRQSGGWRPADLPGFVENVRQTLERIGKMLQAAESSGATVALSLPTLPTPPIDHTPGWQNGTFELELLAAAHEFALHASRVRNVRVLNASRLDRISAPGARMDLRSWLTTGFPYTFEHASALAGLAASLVLPRTAKKALITDLDNTLWSGIAGEAGPAAVSWDLDHGSQIHAAYQQLLAAFAGRGVLIGVASKNDPEVAGAALARPDILIPRDALFPVEANWAPKSESVARILEAWNIGDSDVVFIDDSPLELDEVKRRHPGIECYQFPARQPAAAFELLETLRDLFGKTTILAEDAIRAGSIRQAAEARAAALAPASQDEFLKQAAGKITFALNEDDPRALDLINKTNQFNLNGRRYSESEWAAYLRTPGVVQIVVSYEDRYGPLGKIAVLTGRLQDQSFIADNWVMSCRAFSRRIEYHCLAYLFEHFAVDQIAFDFRQTPRNGPIQNCLSEFTPASTEPFYTLNRTSFELASPKLCHQISLQPATQFVTA